MAKHTLLQKARMALKPNAGPGSSYSKEEIELAIAYFKGEVQPSQVWVAIGGDLEAKSVPTRVMARMSGVLRWAARNGMVKIG